MSEHAPNEHVTAGEPGHPAPAHALGATAFSETEWAALQADDFAAGKAVVILMLSIFSTGVLIYAIVAYWVMFFSRA
jgi:hypothetical protein